MEQHQLAMRDAEDRFYVTTKLGIGLGIGIPFVVLGVTAGALASTSWLEIAGYSVAGLAAVSATLYIVIDTRPAPPDASRTGSRAGGRLVVLGGSL